MPYSALEAKEIATLCTVVDCEHKTAPYVEKSDYLVVRTSNVRNGQLLMEDMKYTTVDGYNEWTQRAVPVYGDVLFTREAPAGESCLVPHDKKVCMGQRMVMLRPNKDVTDPIFLSLILNTERTKTDISRLSIGSTVSRINIADIKKLKVASPPLPEQRKIAKILSTWDKAITTTEKLVEASKQQKKALMQQLLTGKKRLLNSETGKVFEGEWEQKLFKHILKLDRGSSPRPIVNFMTNANDGVNWIKIGDTKKGELYINSTKEKITPEGAKKSRKVSKGEVIVSNSMSYGQPYILNIDGYIHDGWFVIRNYEEHFEKSFLLQILGSELTQRQYKRLAAGGVVSNISSDLVYAVKALLPPLIEQQKIASVLMTADKEIEVLEAKLAHFKQEKKALMQQLLTGKRRVKVDEMEVA
ncbi:Type I restriction-modification system, specificity subunit S [Vibrio harveyi]|uniref:restriction endonuclease subunit S n=1 Tax=Vibrio harveyi TaxID=669 RepID=UPI002894D04C|nr:Type I restriction-modification system, specificity subunit S [Vibrio harveyi]CAH1554562.1 Type I restriction-modification system, specificity subunit S [Vibrio harveyi]CAH1561307.1 Type I restriction-modification system, specificity subunit S [Vibrio harveyi]